MWPAVPKILFTRRCFPVFEASATVKSNSQTAAHLVLHVLLYRHQIFPYFCHWNTRFILQQTTTQWTTEGILWHIPASKPHHCLPQKTRTKQWLCPSVGENIVSQKRNNMKSHTHAHSVSLQPCSTDTWHFFPRPDRLLARCSRHSAVSGDAEKSLPLPRH